MHKPSARLAPLFFGAGGNGLVFAADQLDWNWPREIVQLVAVVSTLLLFAGAFLYVRAGYTRYLRPFEKTMAGALIISFLGVAGLLAGGYVAFQGIGAALRHSRVAQAAATPVADEVASAFPTPQRDAPAMATLTTEQATAAPAAPPTPRVVGPEGNTFVGNVHDGLAQGSGNTVVQGGVNVPPGTAIGAGASVQGKGIAVGAGAFADNTSVAIGNGAMQAMGELKRQRNVVVHIVQDWIGSNDGIPLTEAAVLDKATSYIDAQLEIRGETWRFDREKRRQLGFPPIVGERYEPRSE